MLVRTATPECYASHHGQRRDADIPDLLSLVTISPYRGKDPSGSFSLWVFPYRKSLPRSSSRLWAAQDALNSRAHRKAHTRVRAAEEETRGVLFIILDGNRLGLHFMRRD